jgi:thioredoxin reductase (NADPH)
MPQYGGAQMVDAFYDHAKMQNVEVRLGRVLQIFAMGTHYSVQFEQELVDAKAVIIATGMAKKQGIPGEADFLGSGVSYCATCDGMLYRGKNVVVIGEIPEAEEDVTFLSEICQSVTYVPTYIDNAKKINRILGADTVTGIEIDGETVSCDGVFIIKAAMPATALLTGLETENGAIKVNRFAETNLAGVYAAGDCTGWPFQVSNAIGEGLVAAQMCARWLGQR